jgi:hypothetical protein
VPEDESTPFVDDEMVSSKEGGAWVCIVTAVVLSEVPLPGAAAGDGGTLSSPL